MRVLIATMFRKVPVRKTQQRATLCKRCGVRIYSLSFLKAHLESHYNKKKKEPLTCEKAAEW
jgi:hypothetical protein